MLEGSICEEIVRRYVALASASHLQAPMVTPPMILYTKTSPTSFGSPSTSVLSLELLGVVRDLFGVLGWSEMED